jgi:hypothetical protein
MRRLTRCAVRDKDGHRCHRLVDHEGQHKAFGKLW